MRITFKRTNGKYTVTVNGYSHTFASSHDAWGFLIGLKQTA